jgi:CDP-glycerol glycerophosphotransferase (TagB/SpsB family)
MYYSMCYEAEMIVSYMTHEKSSTVIVRNHPNWDIKKEVLERIPCDLKNRIQFDNESDLFKQILEVDVIATTNYSTIMWDALALNKPVIRMHSPATYPEIFDFRLIRDVFKKEYFEIAVNEILAGETGSSQNELEEFLVLDENAWKSLVNTF